MLLQLIHLFWTQVKIDPKEKEFRGAIFLLPLVNFLAQIHFFDSSQYSQHTACRGEQLLTALMRAKKETPNTTTHNPRHPSMRKRGATGLQAEGESSSESKAS